MAIRLNESKLDRIIKETIKQTKKNILEGSNSTGLVIYHVVDKERRTTCGLFGYKSKEKALRQLQMAKELYPGRNWQLEATFFVNGKEKLKKIVPVKE